MLLQPAENRELQILNIPISAAWNAKNPGNRLIKHFSNFQHETFGFETQNLGREKRAKLEIEFLQFSRLHPHRLSSDEKPPTKRIWVGI